MGWLKLFFFYTFFLFIINPMAFSEEKIPSDVLKELSRDLAEINKLILERQATTQAREGLVGYYTKIRVTKDTAYAYAGASWEAGKIAQFAAGKVLPVIDKAGPWYAVDLGEEKTGWVNATQVVPTGIGPKPFFAAADDLSTRIYTLLTNKLAELKEKYEKNLYIKVKGFSVSLGMPMSVTIDFEFR